MSNDIMNPRKRKKPGHGNRCCRRCCVSLRDYFAATALQGFLANPTTMTHIGPVDVAKGAEQAFVVDCAYALADAMIQFNEE